MHSATFIDHFQHPRNTGTLEAPDATGQAGSPEEGGQVALQLQLRGEVIAAARFQTFGCGYAIAACSALTEWITGKSRAEARQLEARALAELLGGVPDDKFFCVELAVKALQHALASLP